MASKPKAVPAAVPADPVKEDVGALLDDLESLVNRAEHFENAGLIGKLRQDGLDLIACIRAAL